jgi:hypothetical protein
MPKSGTHLVEQMLCDIPEIYRPFIRTLNPRNIEKYGGFPKVINSLKNGELLITHAHYSPEISAALIKRKCIVIFLSRKPEAMVLSFAHYLHKDKKHRLHEQVKTFNLSDTIDFCTNHKLNPKTGTFVQIMQLFDKWKNHDGIFLWSFEDLVGGEKNKKIHILDELIRKLDIDFKSEKDRTIMISNMISKSGSKTSTTFRSGNIDEWKDQLTIQQIQNINDQLGNSINYE